MLAGEEPLLSNALDAHMRGTEAQGQSELNCVDNYFPFVSSCSLSGLFDRSRVEGRSIYYVRTEGGEGC